MRRITSLAGAPKNQTIVFASRSELTTTYVADRARDRETPHFVRNTGDRDVSPSDQHWRQFWISPRHVRTFRRGFILYIVAWCLIVLGASPVTAPFSTFAVGDATQHGTNDNKTFGSPKIGHEKVIDLDGATPWVSSPRILGLAATEPRPCCLAQSGRHEVLRI
jgi:hypothetical protein